MRVNWKRIRKSAAAGLLLAVILTCAMAQVGLQSVFAWDTEFLRYVLVGHGLGSDVSSVTGMLQFTDGSNNGYMEAEIVWDGPHYGDYGCLELILSINYPEHNRFDVAIWMWEEDGPDEFEYGFDHGYANRYHRLMFRVDLLDAWTLRIRIWDCDDEYQLLFDEEVEIEQELGVGGLSFVTHAHEYWDTGFDTIGFVEYHELYDPQSGWLAFNDIEWEDEYWSYWDVEHLYGFHDWTRHDCGPSESLRERTTPTPSPSTDDKPLYSGNDVHNRSPVFDLKTSGSEPPPPRKYAPNTNEGPGTTPPAWVLESVCNAREEASEDWSRTLFWHSGNVPTATPTATNTPIPTCTPRMRPTVPPPSLDIEIDLPVQQGVGAGWSDWGAECVSPRFVHADWRAPGTPCPPLGFIRTVGSSGWDWFDYASGTPSPPFYNKRACVSIRCLTPGGWVMDTDTELFVPPPICTGWWEEAVRLYHPQGRGDLGCYASK